MAPVEVVMTADGWDIVIDDGFLSLDIRDLVNDDDIIADSVAEVIEDEEDKWKNLRISCNWKEWFCFNEDMDGNEEKKGKLVISSWWSILSLGEGSDKLKLESSRR